MTNKILGQVRVEIFTVEAQDNQEPSTVVIVKFPSSITPLTSQFSALSDRPNLLGNSLNNARERFIRKLENPTTL